MAEPLIRILDDLATHRKKLVLIQGSKYWRIEDLVRQAKQDLVRSGRAREALTARIYTTDEREGKVVILLEGTPVFVEAGSDIRT